MTPGPLDALSSLLTPGGQHSDRDPLAPVVAWLPSTGTHAAAGVTLRSAVDRAGHETAAGHETTPFGMQKWDLARSERRSETERPRYSQGCLPAEPQLLRTIPISATVPNMRSIQRRDR